MIAPSNTVFATAVVILLAAMMASAAIWYALTSEWRPAGRAASRAKTALGGAVVVLPALLFDAILLGAV